MTPFSIAKSTVTCINQNYKYIHQDSSDTVLLCTPTQNCLSSSKMPSRRQIMDRTIVSHFCEKIMEEIISRGNEEEIESVETFKNKLHTMCYMFIGASLLLNMSNIDSENITILAGEHGPFFPEIEKWWEENVAKVTF